jgi:hypothetical protein
MRTVGTHRKYDPAEQREGFRVPRTRPPGIGSTGAEATIPFKLSIYELGVFY